MPRSRRTEVLRPNLGLFLDRPHSVVPPRALIDCRNVRIKEGRIRRDNMGWAKFINGVLPGIVTMIDSFFNRAGGVVDIYGTTTDLFRFDPGINKYQVITPVYSAGTVVISDGSATVTGTGTLFDSGTPKNVKATDRLIIGTVDTEALDPLQPNAEIVQSVDSDTQLTMTANMMVPNLFTRSEELDDAAWTKDGVTIVADDIAAPDLTVTADKINETATTGLHRITRQLSLSAFTFYTFSCYVKPLERTECRLLMAGVGIFESDTGVTFDLSAGTITATGAGSNVSGTIAAVANGFFRLTITAETTLGGGNADMDLRMFKAGAQSYLGTVSEGLHAWGFQFEQGSAVTIYLRTVATAQQYDGPYKIFQVFTGDKFDRWSTEIFPDAVNVIGVDGDRWYATNGIDGVVGWDGATETTYRVAAIGITPKVLALYKNRMVYANFVDSGQAKPYSIRTSVPGQPEDVTTAPAAEFVVHDGADPIVDLYRMGDLLAILSERSIVLAQDVDLPLQLIFRTAVAGLGPLSQGAIADFGDFLEFLGPDAQYRFDGVTVTEVGFQVWREILRTVSPNRLGAIISHFDEENGDLIWGLPLSTDPDVETGNITTGYVEHYLELVGEDEQSPVTIRDFPATAVGFGARETTLRFSDILDTWADQNYRWNDRFFLANFPFNLFGDENGQIFILNELDSQDGSAFASWWRFPRRAFGDATRKGMVRRIYSFLEQLDAADWSLEVRLYGSDSVAGKSKLLSTSLFDPTFAGNRFVSPRKVARYGEIEYYATGTGVPISFEGYDVDSTIHGAGIK
ncbi:MAG: phage head spike fiber domain-containing protein [Gammaproteobacteria bacterium]